MFSIVTQARSMRRRQNHMHYCPYRPVGGALCIPTWAAVQVGLTKALAQELGVEGIRVNCVAPGAPRGCEATAVGPALTSPVP